MEAEAPHRDLRRSLAGSDGQILNRAPYSTTLAVAAPTKTSSFGYDRTKDLKIGLLNTNINDKLNFCPHQKSGCYLLFIIQIFVLSY